MEYIQLMVLANQLMAIAFASIMEVEWNESGMWFFSNLGSYLGSFLLSMEIQIMNILYKKVTIWTTSRGNLRTDTVFEDVLIAALAVLAVFQGLLFVNIVLAGDARASSHNFSPHYHGSRPEHHSLEINYNDLPGENVGTKTRETGAKLIAPLQHMPFVTECTYTSCLDSLCQSLAIIFYTRLLIAKTFEVYLTGFYMRKQMREHHPHQQHQHQHQQSHLPYQRGVDVSGNPIRGSAAPCGGIDAPGVGGQGLSQHRRGPSHPKGSRYGSSVGGRGKRRGGRGKGRGKKKEGRRGSGVQPWALEGVASTAKNGLPSPSDPMPRGLANAPGQNNCFLNVVVQSLWHLDAFRTIFGEKTNISTSQGVESALRALFRELSGGQVGDGGKGEGAGNTLTTSASVEALRVALSTVPGGRFVLGGMDDAAEATETILDCLVQGSSAAAIRRVFTMRIREVLTCPKCGIFSPEVPTTYESYVFYAHTSALLDARTEHPVCSFDVALREASLGDMETCSNGDCPLARRQERLPSRRSITGEPPSVFSLGLVWNNWGPGLVADLLQMLNPVIDLDEVFRTSFNKRGGGGIPGMTWPMEEDVSIGKAHLRAFYCFHVQKHHYVAFVYNRGRGEWILLDDDHAIPIGPKFSSVRARCKKDQLHPSLLFYERQPSFASSAP